MAVMGFEGFPVGRGGPVAPRGERTAPGERGGPVGALDDDRWRRRGRALLTTLIGAALALVILAPALLSSSDLLRWASSPDGLGLPVWWAWLAFVALDAAAVVCVGMVTLAAWRGEGGGTFELLTWVFASGSAWANYRHGLTTAARDDEFFFPAMSLAGPLLLHVTLSRVRRWYRVDTGRQSVARPRFGLRWLPGVAFRQTLRAWQAAVREGLDRPDSAVVHVREREMLRRLAPIDQVHLAWQALGRVDPHEARTWLAARGVFVGQVDLADAYRELAAQADGASRPGAGEPEAPDVSVSVAPEPVRLPSKPDGSRPGGSRPGGSRPGGSSPAGTSVARDDGTLAGWQRRRLSVAVGLVQADPDLPLSALVAGLQAHGHEVSDRVAERIYAEAVEFLRAEAPYAS